MNALTLDKTNPDIAAAIAGWQDGGEYNVSLVIRQTKSDPAMATFEVVDVQVEEAPEEPVTNPTAAPATAPTTPPAVAKVASSYKPVPVA